MVSRSYHSNVHLQQKIQVFIFRELEEPQRKGLQALPDQITTQLNPLNTQSYHSAFQNLRIAYEQTAKNTIYFRKVSNVKKRNQNKWEKWKLKKEKNECAEKKLRYPQRNFLKYCIYETSAKYYFLKRNIYIMKNIS